MRRFLVLAPGFGLSLALWAIPAGAARADFDTNLIVNPGAEAGSGSSSGNDVLAVPGWTTVGNFTVVQYGAPGGFPSSTDPGPPDRGLNFFAGGPSNGSSGASQVVNLAAADFAQIDAGVVTFNLSGYLGGFASQGDNAVLSVSFLSGADATLGTASIGPVTAADRGDATGLLLRSTMGDVPVGTRMVDVDLQMTRTDGSYNDAYADNLSLILHSNAVPEPSGLVLLGIGMLGLSGYCRRRMKARA